MKRRIGETFPRLQLVTSTGKHISVPDGAARWTHVQFRRWSGCPICNTHLASFRRNAEAIARAGIQEVIFFHSKPEEIAEFHRDFPFDLVGDPEKKYYRDLGVESSWLFFADPRTVWPSILSVARGRVNLRVGGGVTGLPADFLVAQDGRIHALKYGKHAYDQWSVEELLTIAQDAP